MRVRQTSDGFCCAELSCQLLKGVSKSKQFALAWPTVNYFFDFKDLHFSVLKYAITIKMLRF